MQHPDLEYGTSPVKERRWPRRVARVLYVVAALSFVAYVLEAPLTSFYTNLRASKAVSILTEIVGEGEDPTVGSGDVITAQPFDYPVRGVQTAYHPTAVPEPGEPFAIMRFPALGDKAWPVIEGNGPAELRQGPGHMVGTAMPGNLGNTVISGHRTTWGAPFNRVDELEAGDEIVIETETGVHVYAVDEVFIVKPNEMWVTEAPETPAGWLTLTSCHPKGSRRERIIVRAELVAGPNAAFVAEMAAMPEMGVD